MLGYRSLFDVAIQYVVRNNCLFAWLHVFLHVIRIRTRNVKFLTIPLNSTRFTCCCDVFNGAGHARTWLKPPLPIRDYWGGWKANSRFWFSFLGWYIWFSVVYVFEVSHWTYSAIIYSDRNIGWAYGTIEFVFSTGWRIWTPGYKRFFGFKLPTANVLHIGFNFEKV